jgi:hypothetical protein
MPLVFFFFTFDYELYSAVHSEKADAFCFFSINFFRLI